MYLVQEGMSRAQMDFNHPQKKYSNERLFRKDLITNPIDQLLKWLKEAHEAKINELNALSLATASREGKPSCRTVLLKTIDERGLVFFTNYNSRKSQEINSNPFAMATFFWSELMRQVCVEGGVEKIPKEESADYFSKRPRGSQIGAWASDQDKVISSAKTLDNNYSEVENRFRGLEIPLPPFWGGFRLIPTRFEFWQGRKNRLHDRFQYIQENEEWKIERQSP